MTAAVAGTGTGQRPGRPYLAPVPDTEPPFDSDSAAPTGRPRRARSRSATTGAANGLVRAAGSTAALTAPTDACEAVPSWSAGPAIVAQRTASAQLPPSGRAAQVLATALVEVLSDRRPMGQLRVHTAPGVFTRLANRGSRGWPTSAQVASVRVCHPADGVAEVSVTVRAARRVRAMAFRMEGVDERWRITALEIG